MNRSQLAHILRAASTIAEDNELLVIGSQAILGAFSEKVLPAEAIRSVEADIAFFNDNDEKKLDAIDGAIGEGSHFHETYSYYGQGVSTTTAVLPTGWHERLLDFQRTDTGSAKAKCLEPHDLVVSKLVAGREKDREFAAALVRAGLVDAEILKERANLLPLPQAVISRITQSIERIRR